ncbi:HEAT repeat domain-containing protein [Candidatus Uabimicrobium sp. HlEnr_7]|uniref:HEAT repeat domain-containing protein n=1 Tax=Candidatus Uabimicrobium helgolandensis TaxID=3095367 RepID=UPI0035592CD0
MKTTSFFKQKNLQIVLSIVLIIVVFRYLYLRSVDSQYEDLQSVDSQHQETNEQIFDNTAVSQNSYSEETKNNRLKVLQKKKEALLESIRIDKMLAKQLEAQKNERNKNINNKQTLANSQREKIIQSSLIAITSNSKAVKLDAIKILKKHKALAAIPVLIDHITHGDKNIRLEATIAIGSFGPKANKATGTLLEVLRNWNLSDRQKAGKSLVQISSSKNFKQLNKFLYDSNNTIKMWASKALAKVGEKSVQSLISALQNKNDYTKKYAVQALATIGSDAASAVPHLVNLLKQVKQKDNDKVALRDNIEKALANIQQN